MAMKGGRSSGGGSSKGSRPGISRPSGSTSSKSRSSSSSSSHGHGHGHGFGFGFYHRPRRSSTVVIVGGSDQEQAAQTTTQTLAPTMQTCDYCGTRRKIEETSCPSCGSTKATPVPGDTVTTTTAGGRSSAGVYTGRRRIWPTLVAIGVVVLIVAIILIISFANNVTGEIGDRMQTQWFDFTVTDGQAEMDNYNGYAVPSGRMVIIVDMTIKNTTSEWLEIYNDDFVLKSKSNSTEDTNYAAYTSNLYQYFDEQLEMFRFTLPRDGGSYAFRIEAGETVSGRLVFLVYDDVYYGQLCYTEYDNNGNAGKNFFVNLFSW